MKLITIVSLLAMIIVCSCSKQTANRKPQMKTGLKIEYKPTRGQSYTDTLGTKYNLRHIPTIITNDSTIPIHIQITFSKEYDYPMDNNEQFKVFPMPEVWALDGVEMTDSILKELPQYIDKPSSNKTLQPGEKWLLGLGTFYPNPINYGVFPVAVFSHDSRDLHHECKELVNPNELHISHSALELLIGFTSDSQALPDSCGTIPFGQISYPEQ